MDPQPVTGEDVAPVVDVEVVIPLKWAPASGPHDTRVSDLGAYLGALTSWVAFVTVVDGSDPGERELHRVAWPQQVRVIEPDPEAWSGPGAAPTNGKVVGAMTGIAAATRDKVVLADDDVRHTRETVQALADALERADLVRPTNVYNSWPWQARWDGARTLVNLAFAADWPGTFGLRRSAVLAVGGWDAHVLFENLELWRTLEAAGSRVSSRPDIIVQRRPPGVPAFLEQRVRQAYDDFAQPGRLAVELALLPAAVLLWWRRPRWLWPASAAVVAAAALGRARVEGVRDQVPADVPLWSVAWCAERAVCVWLAVFERLRGGARYRGSRLSTAAHRPSALRPTQPASRARTPRPAGTSG